MESDAERNAQDWFRLMVDTSLAPGMRGLGFFGAGRRFRMEIGGHWAEVALAQSRSLTERSVRFTLHLGVVSRDEWTEQLRVRPYYPMPDRATCMGWQAPIGRLVVVGGYPIGELWWELEVGQPFDSLADEVLTAVRVFGLPAMCHQIRVTG